MSELRRYPLPNSSPRPLSIDASGHFAFNGLRAEVYSVQQLPPGNYIAETDLVGSLGGTAASPVLISDIHLHNGQNGINYNFLDVVPVVQQPTFSISGAVPNSPPGTVVEIRDNFSGVSYLVTVENDTYTHSGLPAQHSYTIVATAPDLRSNQIAVDSLMADLTGQDLLLNPLS